MNIKDNIPIICHNALSPFSIATHMIKRITDQGPRHGNDLNRQRKRSQRCHHFAAVRNANEFVRFRCGYLLSRQSGTSAFDKKAFLRRFVRTVDVDINAIDGI
jgi:hypothetical protein